jgi:hypothetical protein
MTAGTTIIRASANVLTTFPPWLRAVAAHMRFFAARLTINFNYVKFITNFRPNWLASANQGIDLEIGNIRFGKPTLAPAGRARYSVKANEAEGTG